MTDDGSQDDELLSSPSFGRRGWWYLLAVVVLLAVIVSVVVRHSHDKPDADATPSPTTPDVPSPSTSSPIPPPTVSRFDAVPGLTGSLYVRTPRTVQRYDLSRARLVTTPLPPLLSSGPVSFVATVRGALVRPDDVVPGYLVPSDDTAAQLLQGALSHTSILPGPRPDRFWMSEPGTAVMKLVDTEGHTVARVALPHGSDPPTPDGSGYLLAYASGGRELLDIRPGRTVRIAGVEPTDDVVVATGADRVLLRRCTRPVTPAQTCPGALVSVTSGRTHKVGTVAAPRQRGVITAGGGTALVYRTTGSGGAATTAQLMELPSGRPRGPAVAVDPSAPPDSATASSDGKWVLLVARDGMLMALDTATGRAHRIGTASGALQVAFAAAAH